MKRPMRFVVAAQQTLSAKVLCFVLAEAGHYTVVVPDADAIVERVSVGETDAVLVCADLPGFDEAVMCRTLRRTGYKGPVFVVTQQESPSITVAALESGADEVLTLAVSPDELLARVRAVVRRYAPSDAQIFGPVLQVNNIILSLVEMTVQVDDQPQVLLTPMEQRILACLMSNSPMLVKRGDLIEQVWGDEDATEDNELDVYIRRLRKKLEPDPRQPTYLHTVRGLGYIFEQRTRV